MALSSRLAVTSATSGTQLAFAEDVSSSASCSGGLSACRSATLPASSQACAKVRTCTIASDRNTFAPRRSLWNHPTRLFQAYQNNLYTLRNAQDPSCTSAGANGPVAKPSRSSSPRLYILRPAALQLYQPSLLAKSQTARLVFQAPCAPLSISLSASHRKRSAAPAQICFNLQAHGAYWRAA